VRKNPISIRTAGFAERTSGAVERPNTVAGLFAKHAAILGQIEHTRRTLAELVGDLEALEHTIRLFDPDAQLGRAKPLPAEHAAFKGEMRRDVLAALRAAQGPLTSLDIARQVIAARKLDPAMTTTIRKRVGAALWKLKARDLVNEVPQPGDYKGWFFSPIVVVGPLLQGPQQFVSIRAALHIMAGEAVTVTAGPVVVDDIPARRRLEPAGARLRVRRRIAPFEVGHGHVS